MLYIVLIILSVIADQLVKAYVTATIPLYGTQPLLPGIVELLYIRNTGGGFSILTDHTWLLTAATTVIMCGIAWLLVKKVFSHPLAMLSLALILGGGLGNLVDRVRLGYVVDMFHLEFFPSYPVFNVADILVVCGTIGFAVYYLFLSSREPSANRGQTAPETEAGDGTDDPAGDA